MKKVGPGEWVRVSRKRRKGKKDVGKKEEIKVLDVAGGTGFSTNDMATIPNEKLEFFKTLAVGFPRTEAGFPAPGTEFRVDMYMGAIDTILEYRRKKAEGEIDLPGDVGGVILSGEPDLEGDMIGAAAFIRFDKSRTFEIARIGANPRYKGAGTAMVLEIARRAAEAGYGLEANAVRSAIGFYQRLGMKQVFPERSPGTHRFTPAEVRAFVRRFDRARRALSEKKAEADTTPDEDIKFVEGIIAAEPADGVFTVQSAGDRRKR